MAYEQRPNTGSLFKNDKKEPGDSKPDYTGTANLNGEPHYLDAWLNKSANGTTYMSVKFKPKEARATMGSAGMPTSDAFPTGADLDDEIPF